VAPVTGKLTGGDLAKVFARMLFIQATIHRRGMQSIGVLHALDAVASRVSSDPAALLARHTDHFKHQPQCRTTGDRRGPADRGGGGVRGAGLGFALQTGMRQRPGSGRRRAVLRGAQAACVDFGLRVCYIQFFRGLVAVVVLYNAALIAVRYRGIQFGYARGWGLIEAFSGSRVQRLLGIARAAAACAGGILIGVVVRRARRGDFWRSR